MLDRTQAGLELSGLTQTECRLIVLYRMLSEQEQLQILRLAEVLATNPDRSVNH